MRPLHATASGLTLAPVLLDFCHLHQVMMWMILKLKSMLKVCMYRYIFDKITKMIKKSKILYLDGQLSTEAGCYKAYDGFGWHKRIDKSTMTMAKCMNHCKTYQNKVYILGGLGNYCYCANSLPESVLLPGSQCNTACSGEPGTEGKCGGSFKWNIHAVIT